ALLAREAGASAMGCDLGAIAARLHATPLPSVSLGPVEEPKGAGWIRAAADECEVRVREKVRDRFGDRGEQCPGGVPAPPRLREVAATAASRELDEARAAAEHRVQMPQLAGRQPGCAAPCCAPNDRPQPLAESDGLTSDGVELGRGEELGEHAYLGR